MLEIRALDAGYGETQIVHSLDLSVGKGQFHAILGRNGAGKSTTLKTVMGLLPATGGSIEFQGKDLRQQKPFDIARLGLAYVPETRDIFGSLSVLENLQLAARLTSTTNSEWTVERVFEFFPNLANRRNNGGSQLSGGEQQMLAIGRALVMNPALLILDEPTEGLAPIIVRQIFENLQQLKSAGMTTLLVEQNFKFATQLADMCSILGRGQCVWSGPAEDLRGNTGLHEQWLGV